MATRVLTYVLIGSDGLSPVANKAGKNVEKSSNQMTKALKSTALAFGALALAGGAIVTKMAIDFQTSMQKIVGLAGVSQKQVNSWSKSILALGGTLPQAPKELADALYFIASSGISGSKALDVLKASAKAAAAGLGTTESVADAVTTALNAYRGTNLTASKSTDILVTAVKDGKAEADQFASSIGRVVPVAATLGVSFDQVSAAMASMTLTGLDADEAATATRGILNSLLKPSAQGAKELKGMGLSFAGLRQELKEKGLLATLMTLKTNIGNNDEALGKIFPNVRALNGFLSLTGKNASQTAKTFGDLTNSTGATDKAFKVASNTTEFKMRAALSGLKSDGIALGSVMLPIIGSMAVVFTKLLTPIAQNKAAFVTLGIGVIAFVAITKVAMAAFSASCKAALVTSVVGIAILALSIAIAELLLHWNTVWSTMIKVIEGVRNFVINDFVRPVVNAFLSWEGMILHSVAVAFGWVPGIGGKLKQADKAFQDFRNNVNNSLSGITAKKVVTVSVAMTAASNPYAGGITGRAAGGGFVHGPGSGTSDTAGLFALSNGEHVTRAASVRKYGTKAMDAINRGQAVVGYRDGGQVGVDVQASVPSGTAVNGSINGALTKLATAFVKSYGGLNGIAQYAQSFLGRIPYVWGGTSVPGGADCSGFVQAIYKHFGIYAPRTSEAQYQWARKSPPIPGGLAFYISSAGGAPPGHVAIVKDANTVISQGGGMGPDLMGMHAMPLMGTGVPPGKLPFAGIFGGNGPINPQATGSLQSIAMSLLKQYGWGNQWQSFDNIENREAGWNMNARNPSSGAYGLAQFINGAGEYATYGGNWLTGLGQLTAMMNYISQRYGSPNRAWQHELSSGWYANGTTHARRGWGVVGERGPELMNFRGGEQVIPNHKLGGDTYIIQVEVKGHALASKAEIGRTVNEAIEYSRRHGNK